MAGYGWAAFAILAILINKRSNGEGAWIELTGVEWRKRTGGTLEKYRGARALEELGLVKVRREGKHSLQFKLAACVDPRSQESKFKKRSAKGKKSKVDKSDTPAMREGDAIIRGISWGTK